MKNFSIDLKASDKGERKKVVQYLRDNGYSVTKRKEARCSATEYLSSAVGHRPADFAYFQGRFDDEEVITLPRDWDKLFKIVQEDKEEKQLKSVEEVTINLASLYDSIEAIHKAARKSRLERKLEVIMNNTNKYYRWYAEACDKQEKIKAELEALK